MRNLSQKLINMKIGDKVICKKNYTQPNKIREDMFDINTRNDIDNILKKYGFNFSHNLTGYDNYYYHRNNGSVILFDVEEKEFYCFETAAENVILFELEGDSITSTNIEYFLKNNI